MLELTITIALFAAFFMLLLSKWNYFELYRTKMKKEPCYFCHCFWLCLFPTVIVAITKVVAFHQFSPYILFVPLLATPITWYISVK